MKETKVKKSLTESKELLLLAGNDPKYLLMEYPIVHAVLPGTGNVREVQRTVSCSSLLGSRFHFFSKVMGDIVFVMEAHAGSKRDPLLTGLFPVRDGQR